MAKVRVIIADTDCNYIIPFQARFADDFYDRVEMEIITERKYFKELFEKPQKAEILIVSEGLYDESLQMHNIGKIFLMTERDEKAADNDLNVVSLFKYTSIKEIFTEIIGECQGLLGVAVTRKEAQVVLITSACGGTGKTTVAMGLCDSLVGKHKRVLYIDAEEFQIFQSMLANPSPITSGEVYTSLARADENIYENIRHTIRRESFDYLPPLKAPLMALGIQINVYTQLIKALKQSLDYDFVVVDTDAVLNEGKAQLMNEADKVFIITMQTQRVVYATMQLVDQISGIANEKYCFICNDFKKDEENFLVASNTTTNFTVSHYVGHCSSFQSVKDYHKMPDIQKAAFLLL